MQRLIIWQPGSLDLKLADTGHPFELFASAPASASASLNLEPSRAFHRRFRKRFRRFFSPRRLQLLLYTSRGQRNLFFLSFFFSIGLRIFWSSADFPHILRPSGRLLPVFYKIFLGFFPVFLRNGTTTKCRGTQLPTDFLNKIKKHREKTGQFRSCAAIDSRSGAILFDRYQNCVAIFSNARPF